MNVLVESGVLCWVGQRYEVGFVQLLLVLFIMVVVIEGFVMGMLCWVVNQFDVVDWVVEFFFDFGQWEWILWVY